MALCWKAVAWPSPLIPCPDMFGFRTGDETITTYECAGLILPLELQRFERWDALGHHRASPNSIRRHPCV